MDDRLTVEQLQQRWEDALTATQAAVGRHPGVYRQLKSLAVEIVSKPVDINDYLPAARKLLKLLQEMDPAGKGTIFHFFNERIAPSSVWDVCWLRLECRDLLAHLSAFDNWRKDKCRLKVLK